MTPRWTESSGKHGVARSSAGWAIAHANYVRDLKDRGDGSVDRLFIGPEHSQTEREVEVIVQIWMDGSAREAVVFHVMQLGPKFRRMREEYPNEH
ncbi:hypothetical protein ACL9RL_01145 [Plantibacter sp. Mn2098]|uniref:hypothetical protein n=1 Tax=Plantibacter sp. Mn2098 TaxID=3395266 RepID=UPI003BE7F867